MSDSKSRVEFEARIKGPIAPKSGTKKRALIISLAALATILATAWAGSVSKADVSAHAAVSHRQPRHSKLWSVTARFGDGTASGNVDYDPPGVGRAVTIKVSLSCGHTHTLIGTQTSELVMEGRGDDSVVSGHTSSAKASKYSRLEEVDWQASGGP